MARQSTHINIPEEYKKNEDKGLCRVCGKPKSQWDKGRRKYCSDDCWWKYQQCFYTWDKLRKEILARDKVCTNCGSAKNLEVDHIIAIVNGGKMWDKNNLRVLCHRCHVQKTKQDLYDRKYVKDGQERLIEPDLTSPIGDFATQKSLIGIQRFHPNFLAHSQVRRNLQ
jgi:hypothetical protein